MADLRMGKPYTGWRKTAYWIIVAAEAVISVWTIAAIVNYVLDIYHRPWPEHMMTLLALWAFGPPLWFWFEHYFIWRDAKENERNSFELHKYGQDLSSKIWIVFVAALAYIVTHPKEFPISRT